MPFTPAEEGNFLKFLKYIDDEVGSRLPPSAAADFFSILVDYSVKDAQFEVKIAHIFYKVPEKLEELKSSIRNVSVLRNTMLQDGANAAHSREVTLNYFYDRIDEYLEYQDALLLEAETEIETLARLEKSERRLKKIDMEKQLQELQVERQKIFELERDERIERREIKKEEEESVRQIRQQEFEREVEERKLRKETIEHEIKMMQQQLQAQHEKDIEERKLIKQKKEYELELRMKKREEEQLKQIEQRKRQKVEKEATLHVRQQKMKEEQERQGAERLEKKKREEEIRAQVVKEINDKAKRK